MKKCLWFIWLVVLPVWGAAGAVTSVTDAGRVVSAHVSGKNPKNVSILEEYSRERKTTIAALSNAEHGTFGSHGDP